MTPEAIRTIAQIRQEFHTVLAAAIDLPVTITKGNSHSSNPAKISWVDHSQRLNYICVYAHMAPDILLPDRPLILRVGMNRGLGFEPARRSQDRPAMGRKLLQFDLTLLPGELLTHAPWVTRLWQAYERGADLVVAAPGELNVKTFEQLVRHGAWTRLALHCLAHAHVSSAAAPDDLLTLSPVAFLNPSLPSDSRSLDQCLGQVQG